MSCQGCGGPLPAHARKWCSERCRKTQYDLVCVECGGRADGTSPSRLSDRDKPVCIACAALHYSVWTREAVVVCMQKWADLNGRTPSATDFTKAQASGYDVPTVNHVRHRFGTWSAAVRAAGLPPRATGRPPGRSPLNAGQRAECARRYAAGESSTVIAADIRCSPQVVTHWARAAGVEIRGQFGRAA